MRLRELGLRRAYDSGARETDVLLDFYIPALGAAVRYDRLAGFFSSASLAVAARGIAGLIQNGGTMRLVACPQFPRSDLALLASMDVPADLMSLAERAAMAALDVDMLADEIARDHVRALGWMLAEGRLEIRLAVPRDMDTFREGLFHQKVGLIADSSGDVITFSGSINETAAAWLENVEQFMVFRSWSEGDGELVDFSEGMFSRYWERASANVEVVPLPDAVSRKLISYAPTDIAKLDLGEYERLRRTRRRTPTVQLRTYQEEAVEAWLAAGGRGILEMATGTGKTKTAAECLARLHGQGGKQFTVITAPYQHIAAQWVTELPQYDPILAHGGTKWKAELANAFSRVQLGLQEQITVVAVQDTAGSSTFLELVGKASSRFDRLVFVGDEVHGLGAPETRKALLDIYTHRLGLSATPTRWFDKDGSRLLEEYFNGVVYTFGIKEALEWHDPQTGLSALCPYRYLPQRVHLDGSELEEYLKLTQRIIYLLDKEDLESQTKLEQLYFLRAGIVKTASQKLKGLESVLDAIPDIRHGLIYCHSKEQMAAVAEVLHRRRITYHRFTGDEGTTPSPEFGGLTERASILKGLDSGAYQVLLAIRCLDEGVDVPSARLGIILASSSNPREHIQRRGRLLRRAPGKHEAVIYDLVVTPDPAAILDPVMRKAEHDVLSKEMERIQEFGANAKNALEVHTWVLKLLSELA